MYRLIDEVSHWCEWAMRPRRQLHANGVTGTNLPALADDCHDSRLAYELA